MNTCFRAAVLSLSFSLALVSPHAAAQQPTLAMKHYATAYVYRPKAIMKGRASHPSVYLDGIELKRLHQGTFFSIAVPSGKHMITSGRSEVGQLVNFEPGREYYFKFTHRNLFLSNLTNAEPFMLLRVADEDAKRDIAGLREVRATRDIGAIAEPGEGVQ